jgi:type I restriction enzyme, R subunit
VDCFDGELIRSFRDKSMMAADPPDKPSRPVEEVIEDVWANRDRPYNVRCLVKRLQRIDKEMSAEARADFEAHGIPDGDVSRYAAGLAQAIGGNFTAEMARLRDKAFQRLLTGYKRRPAVFISATGNVDEVSSEYLLRDAEGRDLKPADYLEQFSRFVRDNPERIEAVGILLTRPAGWGVAALDELRRRLRACPQGFDPNRLEYAHRVHHGKPGIDLVSMVKHAADHGEPLLTAAERATRAVERLGTGRVFTTPQVTWLGRVRDHLAANLSVSRDDFDAVPVLADSGGWGAADKAFAGELAGLVDRLNEEFAR